MAKENIYAAYKGDEFLDIGTKKQLARKLHIKIETISFLASPAYRKRVDPENNDVMIIIKIGKIGDGFEKIPRDRGE